MRAAGEFIENVLLFCIVLFCQHASTARRQKRDLTLATLQIRQLTLYLVRPIFPLDLSHGVLKTDVVFFGDNVKREIVDRCYDATKACDTLMVVGSSLAVFSAYRFVKRANEWGKKILILNSGETRGDDLCDFKWEGDVGKSEQVGGKQSGGGSKPSPKAMTLAFGPNGN